MFINAGMTGQGIIESSLKSQKYDNFHVQLIRPNAKNIVLDLELLNWLIFAVWIL